MISYSYNFVKILYSQSFYSITFIQIIQYFYEQKCQIIKRRILNTVRKLFMNNINKYSINNLNKFCLASSH